MEIIWVRVSERYYFGTREVGGPPVIFPPGFLGKDFQGWFVKPLIIIILILCNNC